MRPGQVLVSNLVAGLLFLVILGIVARKRARLCWSFVVYLAALLIGNRLTIWWPELFYTHRAWTIKGFVYTALAGVVVVEVALLTFSQAPRARRRALIALGAVLLFAAAATTWAAPKLTGLWLLAPGGETTVLWMLATVIGLAGWHRLPLHAYHRAIVVGYTLYLTFDVVMLSLLGNRRHSEPTFMRLWAYFAALDPLAFAAAVSLWAWAAWRPLEVRQGVLASLQPWASRC